MEVSSNKCIASSNRCLTSSNKKPSCLEMPASCHQVCKFTTYDIDSFSFYEVVFFLSLSVPFTYIMYLTDIFVSLQPHRPRRGLNKMYGHAR